MLTFFKNLIKPKLTSLNTITLNRNALLHNLALLQGLKPNDVIFPVLKSNAYGHGLKEVCQILKNIDLPYVCVDSVPEYFIVKKWARKKSLLIGETLPQNYKHLDPRRATVCVYNLETIKALVGSRKAWKIHLFLNTGMNREGIQMHELGGCLDLLKDSSVVLEGVMSHFANADEPNSSFCDTQIVQFKKMLSLVRQYNFDPIYIHIGNSAGIAKIDDDEFTAWRSGIAFYGYSPLVDDDPYAEIYKNLQPALSVQSTVVALQRITAGDIVSYGGRFVAPEDMMVASIPFGYTEGLNRSLRDVWSVQWSDKTLPLIGTICMNLCSVDCRGYDLKVGDQIHVITDAVGSENTIVEYAKKINTIPYEVLVNLDGLAKRVID